MSQFCSTPWYIRTAPGLASYLGTFVYAHIHVLMEEKFVRGTKHRHELWRRKPLFVGCRVGEYNVLGVFIAYVVCVRIVYRAYPEYVLCSHSLLWPSAVGSLHGHMDPWPDPAQMVLWLFFAGGFLQSIRSSKGHRVLLILEQHGST